MDLKSEIRLRSQTRFLVLSETSVTHANLAVKLREYSGQREVVNLPAV